MRQTGLLGTIVMGAMMATVIGCDQIESRLIERAAARGLAGDHNELLDDGNLHVILCGTGSPIADPERAGPCTAVLAGGHFVLVDVGPGSWREVALLHLPRARLEAVLLTHFHSDHIGELGEARMQSWVAGRTRPLLVYGPPGVEPVVDGFRQAYAFDTQYRIAHHGAEAMPPDAGTAVAKTITLPAPDEAALVFDADGLRVTAFAVDHAPVAPAVGYRFDYRGRSVVISGDTKKSANLIKHAKDATLLVHEALAARMIAPVTAYARAHDLSRWAKLTSDVVTYHTTPIEAAEVAKAANVRMLALTHIVPPLQNFVARRMFLRGVSDAWSGPVELGRDGMHFILSPSTDSVTVETLS
ncbi:MAG TPA: MBL fold metallo-hydrolase [Candidatus Binatia bacterium]|nr:MBL fold metallo-hydrolase [Candidatus Binatia bacterium]